MLKGYQNGVITEERLTDALRRILVLKAKLHLPEKQANGTLLRTREDLNVIGCEEHLQWRAEAADVIPSAPARRSFTLKRRTNGYCAMSSLNSLGSVP